MKALTSISLILGVVDFREWLADVETSLVESVSTENVYLSEPAIRVIKGGGKRLRPSLVITSSLVGGAAAARERTVSGCCSVELVHVGSLVHDDIIDEAAERRGVPTVNSLESVSAAILVGDFLLARAGERAASVSAEVSRVLASTIGALCDGQSREMADMFNQACFINDFEVLDPGKTASLLSASCEIGGLCGEQPAEVVSAGALFGSEFGMAFQIIDDILDLTSTAEVMGKPVGNDIREGVYTLPVLLALEGPSGDEIRALLPLVREDGAALERLRQIILASGCVTRAADTARDYNERAVAALEGVPDGPYVEGMKDLPAADFVWALDGVID